ncbi:MAG: methionine synthase [Acidobacteriota bacterium]
MTEAARRKSLHQALETRILVLDGAMGTALQARDLGSDDFGGPSQEGCNEILALTRPEVIRSIHREYLQAGADIIETNTFGSTSLVLDEYGLADRAEEITQAAATLARQLADEASTPERPRWVAGSMGPTTKAISVTGGVTFDALRDTFRGQARALIQGGVDYLLVETCQDTRNIKAALLGCQDAFQELGREIPLAVSGTIEPTGTMLAGQGVEALNTSLEHVNLLYIGLNCATGPSFMGDHIRALADVVRTRVACVPNAGLPDEDGRYLETPETLARVLKRFVDHGWLNLVGGCCGTGAEHIRALAAMAAGRTPRPVPSHRRTCVSGIENLELEEANRPVLVGERTNVIGSRRFKEMIRKGQYEEAAEIGRRQVKKGAQILDLCLADPDGDERADMEHLLESLIRLVKVPLMLDSTDKEVLAAALPWCQGKSIINSINLEDGEARFRAVVPLGRQFGAAFVVGCIDDDPVQGMAITRTRKLEVARRSLALLTTAYGLDPSQILFDPLVFPCGTGDPAYVGSARETVEGVRLIKEAFPECKTILGISNVSFGLPPAGREVLNSVFLYHCTRAGLDAAIVNSEKLERYPSIPEAERQLAEDLLFAAARAASEAALAAFTSHFRAASSRLPKKEVSNRSLDERLAGYILEGTKDGLIPDLEEARRKRPPLDIINGPLMAGMAEVGRLFNRNELIVAEVLQSAEAMKAAVAHLEQFMEKIDASCRGTVVLATVKGDVHDIGKNLVDIILANNGYRVVNLGIKVPPHALISALEEHHPDIVGLSGLLVKSTREMVATAEEFAAAGWSLPLMVGGAALTRSFVRRRIAPVYPGLVVYAPDAMAGLDLAGRLLRPEDRPALEEELRREATLYIERRPAPAPAPQSPPSRKTVTVLEELPAAPDFERHVLSELNLDEIWSFLNPAMLYGKHLGLKGRFDRLLREQDSKALFVQETVERVKEECRQGALRADAIYRFVQVEPDGNRLLLFAPGEEQPVGALAFPRQAGGDRLCLADYIRAPLNDGRRDTVCLMVTGAGTGIRERAARYREEGSYLKSHTLQALALETAESAMEWLHAQVRALWGFPDDPGLSKEDLFKTRYRGRRYSPGYAACPSLEDQDLLFRMLLPQAIGITLTEGYMMDPEASVSAIAFHHPEAVYFNAGSPSAGPPGRRAAPRSPRRSSPGTGRSGPLKNPPGPAT